MRSCSDTDIDSTLYLSLTADRVATLLQSRLNVAGYSAITPTGL